ncbi:large subunit ribosomal protein L1, partial [Tremellales sp. Uapishka_1]
MAPNTADDWSTCSDTSSLVTSTPITLADPPPRKHRRKPQPSSDPLQRYFEEQTRLFKHLEKRFFKFNKKFQTEQGRAKEARRNRKSDTAVEVNKVNQPPPIESPTMLATKAVTNVKNGLRVAGSQVASSSRSLSTTPSNAARASGTSSKKKKLPPNEDAMALSEAARVLRALEISNPTSSYSLTLTTKHTKSSLPLRGRVSLPLSPLRTTAVILVFAEPGSSSYALAEAAGAHFVGGEELFPKVLSGEIVPTKVLSTPGMMQAVSSKLARYLGPKGLMPVAKRGGVVEGAELEKRIREMDGEMEWRGDKLGIVRAPVARMNFSLPSVETNVRAFIAAVKEGSSANESNASAVTRGKKTSTILQARIESTNGPSIELNDVL